MLAPDTRSLYTDALTPPPGCVLDAAIATTYSLDPQTLLTVPVHLALMAQGRAPTLDPIAIHEALRRITDRTTVYAQRGRMQAPRVGHPLFSLLERMVVEVASPRGGAFHPKLWLMRFVPRDGGTPVLRLLVLSRNLTADRSWDICLRLDGERGVRERAGNRELADFIRGLPALARESVRTALRRQAEDLAGDLQRIEWELPAGFDELRFHVVRERPWQPASSERLAVISPFLGAEALRRIAHGTGAFAALVSRPECLAELGTSLPDCESRYVLQETAELEDGEEAGTRDGFGLHAKVFIAEQGKRTHIYAGSANATDAALVHGRNVEVMVEVAGPRRGVGGIEQLLGDEGLGAYLAPWTPGDTMPEADAARLAAERAMESARQAIAAGALRIVCSELERGSWQLRLEVCEPVALTGVTRVTAWPVSLHADRAVDAAAIASGQPVALGTVGPAQITGIIGFNLASQHAEVHLRFALNLPLENCPVEREGAILRAVLDNREGFLRYLLLLLADFTEEIVPLTRNGAAHAAWSAGSPDAMPLLEEMARAYSRDPARLQHIRRLMQRLCADDPDSTIVPREFVELWAVFEQALSGDPA